MRSAKVASLLILVSLLGGCCGFGYNNYLVAQGIAGLPDFLWYLFWSGPFSLAIGFLALTVTCSIRRYVVAASAWLLFVGSMYAAFCLAG